VPAPWLFLVVAAWGASWTAISYRPPRRPGWVVVAAFFAAWLTTELAVLHVAWQAVATIAFVWAGALRAWPGWVGLGVTSVSWAALLASAASARRT